MAYASLADVARVGSVLLYPRLGAGERAAATVARVTSGRRRVRLVLAGVPFGFAGPEGRERCLGEFREVLAG